MEQYQTDLALCCPYAIKGNCIRHRHKCWNYHPPKACPHIGKKICEICDFPSVCEIVCPKSLKNGCEDGNCRYYHGKRRDKEIRRNRQKYSNLSSIPPDILKIIIADCYASDLQMINRWFKAFILQYFPLRMYIFKGLSASAQIARKKNDAIFQVALKIFKCESITYQPSDAKIKHAKDINLLEWQDEEFYLFRQKLIHSKYYYRDETKIINSANLFLALKSTEPLIMPLEQCTTFLFKKKTNK